MRTLFQKIGKIEFQSYDKCDLDMAMAAVTNKNMSLVPKGYMGIVLESESIKIHYLLVAMPKYNHKIFYNLKNRGVISTVD